MPAATVVVTLSVASVADTNANCALLLLVPMLCAVAWQLSASDATILIHGRLSSAISPVVTNVSVDAAALVTLAVLHDATVGAAAAGGGRERSEVREVVRGRAGETRAQRPMAETLPPTCDGVARLPRFRPRVRGGHDGKGDGGAC